MTFRSLDRVRIKAVRRKENTTDWTDKHRFSLFDVGFIRRIGRLQFCDRWQKRRVRDVFVPRVAFSVNWRIAYPGLPIRRLTDAPNGALIVVERCLDHWRV